MSQSAGSAEQHILPSDEDLIAPQYCMSDILSVEIRPVIYVQFGVPFYHAAISGDTPKAIEICDEYSDIVRERITYEGETGLHIAAGAKNLSFVRMLVSLMNPADIALTNNSNYTALYFAAASGVVDIAKALVEKDENLPFVRGKEGLTPLHVAASSGHRDMVNYLSPLTDLPDILTFEDRVELFISVIKTNLYDVALNMLSDCENLFMARDKHKETALHVLARKLIPSEHHNDRGFWKGLTSAGFNTIVTNIAHENTDAINLVGGLWALVVKSFDDGTISEVIEVPTPLLFVATASGNAEFIKILLELYPELIWKVDDINQRRSMFHVSVYYRQGVIFRILNEIGAIKDLKALDRHDDQNNNILHMAAKLAPSDRLGIVSGSALQFQRELRWFREVEKTVHPSFTEMKNDDGLTPKEVFVLEHKELRKEGEAWMKNTAQSYMLVAVLIVTVMFAAAFTLPGGTMDNGTPNYLKKQSFLIFVICDSMSLFFSTTSILMFLSIFSSRYREEDFLLSLPTQLLLGLVTLFFSMATMMLAFTASMFIIFAQGSHHGAAAFLISFMACIPVTLYALLQFNLWSEIFFSTYGSELKFHQSGGKTSISSYYSVSRRNIDSYLDIVRARTTREGHDAIQNITPKISDQKQKNLWEKIGGAGFTNRRGGSRKMSC
ncbi:hypothetical protein QQ045_008559 [Rhodiola kirilowii]